MGVLDWLKKEQPDTLTDTVTDLTLKDLRVGFYVDYDLQTWQVTGAHYYDWNGERTLEWQLESPQGVRFLSMDPGDVPDWSMSQNIEFASLGQAVRQALLQHGEPPAEVIHENVAYTLQETSGGLFYENGLKTASPGEQKNIQDNVSGKECIIWDYEDAQGEKYLSIEQWGETAFGAATGWPVEEYQFNNILPPG